MSTHSQLNTKDAAMHYKPAMTQSRKVAGRVVEEEIETPSFNDDDIGGLLAGVSESDLESGRDRIASENPEYAANTGHTMISNAMPADFVSEDLSPATHVASTMRLGSFMDNETKAVIDFKRLTNGSVQLTSSDDGSVLDTLSSADFDEVLSSDLFTVL